MTLLDQNPQNADPLEEPGLEVPVDDRNRVVPAIEFKDVELAFDDKVVLDKVNFTVRRGETKIVLGGSGTGKSTIINLVLGLLKPDAGQVFVEEIGRASC